MNLAKFSHKTVLVGLATLLALSVGASSSNLTAQPVHARTHRVHHHHRHYRHHSHRRHHSNWRARRRMRRNNAKFNHYERIWKHDRKMAAKARWWTEHIYQDPSINYLNRPYKLHKNLWTQGYLDGTQDGNVSPLHRPCVNAHHIYSTHGKAGNYRLGWIAGYVNGNQENGYVPVHRSLTSYMMAMQAYHNTARAVSRADGASDANGSHGYYGAQGARMHVFHTWITHYKYHHGHLVHKYNTNYRSVIHFE